MERMEHMYEFLQVISEVFTDITSRLEQFEAIKCRLDKLEAAQTRPSFSQVVGASGLGAPSPAALPVRKPTRVRKKRGPSSSTAAPAVAPLRVAVTAPPVLDQHRIPAPPAKSWAGS
ncbi:hypothetical protein AVEN_117413-1 [Araneus ventricosus]|uniref:Uncharacterized protein n=1 Tax=Araneus ventricosus TaxID=182803 RepID=A0A4Y2E3F1_ARAVE|nr:hypothetical protein AVEN_117413-1 [Araneus ventricosus]